MTKTPHLSLPLLAAHQAQKDIIVNEALHMLDHELSFSRICVVESIGPDYVLEPAKARVFDLATTTNCRLVIAAGLMQQAVTLIIIVRPGPEITWPANIKWARAELPGASPEFLVVHLITTSFGESWYGMVTQELIVPKKP